MIKLYSGLSWILQYKTTNNYSLKFIVINEDFVLTHSPLGKLTFISANNDEFKRSASPDAADEHSAWVAVFIHKII